MRAKTITLDPANVDTDGISDGVSTAVAGVVITGALTSGADLDGIADGNSSAGASVTIDGVLAGDGFYQDNTGYARHIYIEDKGADDQSGATYTITGLDATGNHLAEAIAGPAASSSVITTGRFSRVNSITIASPAAGSTVDIGVNGIFISADGLGRQLNIIDTATVDQSGATFTIVGTDADGYAQTEAVTGPASGATVESTKYFLTVTSITIASPAALATADIGTVDEVSTKTYVLDHYRETAPSVGIDVTGTINIDVQLTTTKVQERTSDQNSFNWIDDDNLAAVTADGHGQISDWPMKAMRFITNSYTNTAEATIELTQSN